MHLGEYGEMKQKEPGLVDDQECRKSRRPQHRYDAELDGAIETNETYRHYTYAVIRKASSPGKRDGFLY